MCNQCSPCLYPSYGEGKKRCKIQTNQALFLPLKEYCESGHRAGLVIRHVKLSSGMASRIMYANNEGTLMWSL